MALKKVAETCCSPARGSEPPDHSAEINRINRLKGQLDGIKRMIEERVYCPDILTQTSAVRSAIASLESALLEKHLHVCVRGAFRGNQTDQEEKIAELLEIFRKQSR